MALLFGNSQTVYFVETSRPLAPDEQEKLSWLLECPPLSGGSERGPFVGPRKEMITPWSTNATDIAAASGIAGVVRIEEFRRVPAGAEASFDRMLQSRYETLGDRALALDRSPEPVKKISNLQDYNAESGLALSSDEIAYLEELSRRLKRPLTDVEVFGFAQLNSEHCRHKIFNGRFVIDGSECRSSLFSLIKATSRRSPDLLVSAYKDNVAFIRGPEIELFAPHRPDAPDLYGLRRVPAVISLKAETHNFPTTVEPFSGASTGSGGEIRDRMAGGRGGMALTGIAVYMTAYPRHRETSWAARIPARPWKYQTPEQILTKASNGASDFGNKFGQPLITGSLLTFEMPTAEGLYAFDRTVMLAGGVGYAKADDAEKKLPAPGEKVVVLGGDNYRIGLAGSSVSSVDTGKLGADLELSAVQRANPEMQKRVYNVVRALAESVDNPVRLIHDHGAGGHLNCLAELLESCGGKVQIAQLPVGDPTLSVRELLSNESQERMGLIVAAADVPLLQRIAQRERAPMYVVGEVTGDGKLTFTAADASTPFQLSTEALFGSAPKTVMDVQSVKRALQPLDVRCSSGEALLQLFSDVLSLEGVACKDWLTNKVDRCVSGLVALQQCAGPLHLPLNDVGVTALDFQGRAGIASAVGHAPGAGLVDERLGATLSVAEALTNIVWAPLADGLKSIALSANWMWPCKQPGEDARLYFAVEALSKFAIDLGIPVPTGKDSLSMTIAYSDQQKVRAPGTVVVTAVGECADVRSAVTADLKPLPSELLYLDFSGVEGYPLGGSSLAQVVGVLGDAAPEVKAGHFRRAFAIVQELIVHQDLLAGHDISSGGLLTAASEMAMVGDVGLTLRVPAHQRDSIGFLFSEKPGVLIQVADEKMPRVTQRLQRAGVQFLSLGRVGGDTLQVDAGALSFTRPVSELRAVWFEPSAALDALHTKPEKAAERRATVTQRALRYTFPEGFDGRPESLGLNLHRKERSGLVAAVIREKGTNGEREMAYALYAAGFDVRDVAVSDLIEGREDLSDVRMLAFPGGFSHSDVMGSGRGWAASLKYNDRAIKALKRFYDRKDTLSLGVCNGCQLMVALGLLYSEHKQPIAMLHNASGRFESAFLNVEVQGTSSILLKPLVGTRLGIWVAHGEGRFSLPEGEAAYDLPMRYVSSCYPLNPNGSDCNAAAVCSKDGRHLVMMPHLERSLLRWHWAYWPQALPSGATFSPWILPFIAARNWLAGRARVAVGS